MTKRSILALAPGVLAMANPGMSFGQTPKTHAAHATTGLSVETPPIGEIVDDPAAKRIPDTYIPGLSKNPQIDMARGMTLRHAQGYAPDLVPEDARVKIEADFGKPDKK